MDRRSYLLPTILLACALAFPGTAAAVPVGASVAASAANVPEGGEITFTITCGTFAPLDLPSTGQLDYVVTGATEGQDYPATAGSVTCAAGPAATHQVTVDLIEDTLDEPEETLSLTISKGALFTGEIATATASTKLVDNDVPEATIQSLAFVVEGTDTAVPLTVTLSQAPVEAVTLNYASEDSSAFAGSDYTATSGQLTIPAGQTTGTISVPILDDAAPEPGEAFYVNLSSPVNATLNETKRQAAVGIFDGDKPPVPAASVPQAVRVQEGHTGTVNVLFPITLSVAPTERVRLDWRTANYTADLADYESARGTVTFEPGQTTKTVSVNVKGDTRDEQAEAFILTLGNPRAATVAAGTSYAIINDDDGPKVGIGRPVPRGKSLILLVTCPETADLCKGRLTATIGKLRAARTAFDLQKDSGRELRLKLSRKARAALAERGRRMKFSARAADTTGATRTTTRRFRVRQLR